jgi:hypothetical protein
VLLLKNFNSILAALAFYTCCPIPTNFQLDFTRIARWAPVIGLLIGGGLGLIDLALDWLEMPILTRSGVIVVVWIWWTGGLHLDGAMDTADGLAVQDPDRRLTVMTDSVTGAFGAMVAVVIMDLIPSSWLESVGTSSIDRAVSLPKNSRQRRVSSPGDVVTRRYFAGARIIISCHGWSDLLATAELVSDRLEICC